MLAQLTSRPKVDRRVRLRQVLALFLIILSVTLFTWEFETLLWLPRPCIIKVEQINLREVA